MNDTVLSIDDGGVCVVTLNRPARLNAINPDLLDGLNTALARADADERIGAVVLTGAGRAFCAGDDLVEQRSMRDADEASIAGFVDAIQEVTRRIMFGDTPVVAAVRGWAVGGAFSWPVNCDFSVWSDDARGFFPELKIGLYPSGAITFLLPLQVGPARARRCSTPRASTSRTNCWRADWRARWSRGTGCSTRRSRGRRRSPHCLRRRGAP